MKIANLFVVILFCIIFFSYVNFIVNASEEVNVHVRVIEDTNKDVKNISIEEVEEGDIVEITNELLKGEEAEVVSVDKVRGRVIVNLLPDTNQTIVTVKLSDLKIIRKKESESLGSLKLGNRYMLIILLLLIVFIMLIICRKKRKKKP